MMNITKLNLSHLCLIVCFYAMNSVTAAPDTKQPEPSKWGLAVSEYVPGTSDQISLRTPTHIAFRSNGEEIITDLKNNRFLYRDGPGVEFKVSPVPVRGHHSVVYNPADKLYYANDTENHRLISFADLSKATIAAQTKKILGVPLKRPHDTVIDPATGWIYALNPNSGHVFRFTAIGKNESVLSLGKHLGGYSRSLTFTNGRLYVIGSATGRIVEVLDWDKAQVKVYKSFGKKRSAPAGSWSKTGLVLNDVEFFNGFWYASSFFTASYAKGTNPDEHKFIRFKTLEDFVSGKWEDLSSLVPAGLTPYYMTVQGESLYLAVFAAHTKVGKGDAILRFTPLKK